MVCRSSRSCEAPKVSHAVNTRSPSQDSVASGPTLTAPAQGSGQTDNLPDTCVSPSLVLCSGMNYAINLCSCINRSELQEMEKVLPISSPGLSQSLITQPAHQPYPEYLPVTLWAGGKLWVQQEQHPAQFNSQKRFGWAVVNPRHRYQERSDAC